MLAPINELRLASSSRKWHNDRHQLDSKSPSLENIATKLPRELILNIFEMACFSPPVPRSSVSGRARSPSGHAYDHETSLSLLTSSRGLNAMVRPILYNHVAILRPSSLASLHRALLTHHSLRRWIKHLDVGTKNGGAAAADWWPLHVSIDPALTPMVRQRWITNGLQAHEQKDLPQRFLPGQRMSLDGAGGGTIELRIVGQAEKDANVDVRRPRRDGKGTTISSDDYIVRLFWMQAAIDLCLLEKGQEEDKRWGARPTLISASDPAARMDLSEEPHSAPSHALGQLRLHLFRRGAPADCFDHPLVFARSKLQRYFIDDMMQPQLQSQGPYQFLKGPVVMVNPLDLDPTCFQGHVGLTRAVMDLVSEDCRIKIHPEVLAESVKLGWKRGLGRTQEKDLEVGFASKLQI